MLTQAVLDEHTNAAEAAAQRHLTFIDRLLADKESLAHQCAQQAQQLKVPPEEPVQLEIVFGVHACVRDADRLTLPRFRIINLGP